MGFDCYDRTVKPVVRRDKNHVQGQSRGMFNVLNNVDRVSSNVQFSHQEALLYVFEDNEAVIKMIIKGRSPTMRHVSRTHMSCACLVVRSNQLGPQNPNQVHRHQLADIRTKGNFTRDEWNQLLFLFNFSHFSTWS